MTESLDSVGRVKNCYFPIISDDSNGSATLKSS